MLREYLHAYAVIMAAQKRRWLSAFHYVDAFAGPGIAVTKTRDPEMQAFLEGSPRIALASDPPFDRYHFIDKNARRLSVLQEAVTQEGLGLKCSFSLGDANPLIRDLASSLSSRERALVFLDPYGLQVEWGTVEALGLSKRADVFINFSLMGVVRNLRRRGGPAPGFRLLVERVMGNSKWLDDVYALQGRLDEDPIAVRSELAADTVAGHYSRALHTVFAHVSRAAIMRNTRGSPVYALVLASQRPRAVAIMNDIMAKYLRR
jgi:three-Cys-motif partner protein